MEEGRDGKEAGDERCVVDLSYKKNGKRGNCEWASGVGCWSLFVCHRQIVVLEVEFGLGKGAVAPLVLGPLGEVVVDHLLAGDAGEAKDAHHHVFGVVAHVEDVAIGVLVLPVAE